MAGESRQRRVRVSRRTLGTIVPRNILEPETSKFGSVVCLLWPDKPALNLSQRVGCSERHANLIIAGRRKPNARVAHVVLGEIIS